MSPLNYIDSNQPAFLAELTEFLSFPSVSTDPSRKDDITSCAQWLAEHMERIGLKGARVMPTAGWPIVYAEWLGAGPEKPTVLFYGHYDVQPADLLEPDGSQLWKRDPFEPYVEDNKIWARGATDDKGQVFLHLKALQALLTTEGSLPINVKVLIEGEEEIGSPSLDAFLLDHKEMLSCDSVLICDTALFAPDVPSICYGLRGLCYMEIHVTGPSQDKHSGAHGGAIENPINALCSIVAQLKDSTGRICIPGFYDAVQEVSQQERDEFALLPFDEAAYLESVGSTQLHGEEGYSTVERLWIRPTLDCNGIVGGFTGRGAKTVLPSLASAKVSMRLVPYQDVDDIATKFENYVREIAPPTVHVRIDRLHGASPVVTSIDGPAIGAARTALEKAYGKKAVLQREGGSIPVVLTFRNILGVDSVLMGFGLNTENLHAPNEHFSLYNFNRGMIACVHYYHAYNELASAGTPAN